MYGGDGKPPASELLDRFCYLPELLGELPGIALLAVSCGSRFVITISVFFVERRGGHNRLSHQLPQFDRSQKRHSVSLGLVKDRPIGGNNNQTGTFLPNPPYDDLIGCFVLSGVDDVDPLVVLSLSSLGIIVVCVEYDGNPAPSGPFELMEAIDKLPTLGIEA